MGADTTSTQLIFFIAATVVAVAAAGILTSVVFDLSGKAEIRGKLFGDALLSDIEIINDPRKVTASPSTVFYVKNVGQKTLDHNLLETILDGARVTTTKALLGGETTFRTGVVAELTYAASTANGDHYLRVVAENGVADEITFRVS